MGLYRLKTEEWLLTEIAEYEEAIKKATLGGGIGVVAGEGRRIEITECDVDKAMRTLRDLVAELARRPGYEAYRTYAISVEIG